MLTGCNGEVDSYLIPGQVFHLHVNIYTSTICIPTHD